ncbi:MAG: peptidoglycan-binding protein [Deltaproteobacteria bacterium]|nr:MAG: peptidoglycan-binding protein [Deltaproteobacteria bacterium]
MLSAFLLLFSLTAHADENASCKTEAATAAYREGFAAQRGHDAENALAAYARCIELDPGCVPCHYENGWSHWARSEWKQTVASWEKVLEIDPNHASTKEWLPQAKANLTGAQSPRSATGLRVPLNITSKPADAPVTLELVARFQNYDWDTEAPDNHDPDIYSPKSARFLGDGSKVYVNSLEGLKTVVYDPRGESPTKLRAIKHEFDADDGDLFQGQSTVFDYPYYKKSPSGDPNQFAGKPVESALSHGDKYLWVPYYRRDYDYGAGSPSAVAIIDTKTDEIVRVMPTGPIPKYVAISPDDKWAAISHWGDNTVAIVDISSGDPATFKYREERMVVERILSQKGLGGDRDSSCGFCLRGTTFTPDSKTLLVARMGGGGIAGFDVESNQYLGSVMGMAETPRHLVIHGDTLFFSSNRSGYVTRVPYQEIVDTLRSAKGERIDRDDWNAVYVGGGARTLEVSPDGQWLFVAVNAGAEVAVVDAAKMEVVSRIRADSYTVGLAVSPDGKQVWTTSQGRSGKGGNSVCVYSVTVNE